MEAEKRDPRSEVGYVIFRLAASTSIPGSLLFVPMEIAREVVPTT